MVYTLHFNVRFAMLTRLENATPLTRNHGRQKHNKCDSSVGNLSL